MAQPLKKTEQETRLKLVEEDEFAERLSRSEERELELEHFSLAKSRMGRTHEESDSNWIVSYADMMTLLVGFFVMLFSFSKVDSGDFEKVRRETTKVFGGEYKKPFEFLTKELKKVINDKQLTDQVFIQESDEGVQITFRGALFFDSGAADLRDQAKDLLANLVPTITENAKDFGLVIEGHTDNRPIYSKIFPSNWELSSVRACTVLRYFLEKGFDANKIKAIGYGDRRPIVPNEDTRGSPLPENESQNRRVVIKILKSFD